MPAANWIYDKGSATPGGSTGTPDIPASPPVTISYTEVRDLYDGKQQIAVYWAPAATATTDNFKGVSVYLEDPDLSAQPNAPLDGSAKLDGSTQLSGSWNPTLELQTADSPAVMILDGQGADRNIRVYLASYGNAKNAVLVRANKTGATPNIMIPVPATAGQYVSGQEYALSVLNAAVTVVNDFDNPKGPMYHLNFYYDEPDAYLPGGMGAGKRRTPLPPGMDYFGGVQTVYEYPSGQRIQAKYLDAKKPETWVSDSYPAVTGTFKVYFASADINQRVNSVVAGVTPVVPVSIVYPPAGTLSSPVVTKLALANNRWTWQPDGTIFEQADLTWTPPDSARYAGVEFWRTDIHPPVKLGDAGDLLSQFTLQVIGFPKTAQAWTITAIAYDYNGKLTDDPNALSGFSPSVTWNVGPPTTGNAPLIDISGVAISFDQELSSDGVVRMRTKITGWVNPVPTDPKVNQYGGCTIARVWNSDTAHPTTWDAALTDTSLTTPWEPAPSPDSGQTYRTWDFYFVSRDPQGVRNLILSGTTPKMTKQFTPMAGAVVVTRPGTAWWDPTEFQWPAGPGGLFTALNFVAAKIFVGSILRVGGGTAGNAASFNGNANGQIAVYNADSPTNKIVAWMGQQNDPTKGTIYGGWFAQLWVGGSGPPTAPLFVDNNGVVVVGGIASGSPYPYISVRNDHGIELGRIGALIGADTSPSDPSYAVLSTLGGAWFNGLVVGGQSMQDWRILAANNTVKFQNIDLFSIHWPTNANDPTNPGCPNAETMLTFGLSAFHADVSGNSSYWKFPGIGVVRYFNGNPTTHGAFLIDRGIILQGPAANPKKLGAFVTFNGDSFGSDSGTFWADLSMFSPVSALQNVYLKSGGWPSNAAGDAYFSLWNQNNVKMFEVTCASVGGTPTITLGGALYMGATVLINNGSTFVGAAVNVNGLVAGTQFNIYNGAMVINNLGQFVGAGVACQTSGIGGSGFQVYSGGWVPGTTVTFAVTTPGGTKTITVIGGIITSVV